MAIQGQKTSAKPTYWDLAGEYHENTKWFWDTPVEPLLTNEEIHAIKPHYKRYPVQTNRRDLPALDWEEDTLTTVLSSRTSAFFWEPTSLTHLEFGRLAGYAAGVIPDRAATHDEAEVRAASDGSFRHSLPSPGALRSLEIYAFPVTLDDEALPTVVHYQSIEHAIMPIKTISPEAYPSVIRSCFGEPRFVLQAPTILVITAKAFAVRAKYGNRGYRYLLMETGHLMQNFYLLATRFGYGIRPWNGFYDDRLHDFLLLDGVNEFVVTTAMIGRVPTSPHVDSIVLEP